MQVKWALYDLSCNSPSFDIFTFIQYAVLNGCDRIWLKPGYNGQDAVYGGDKGERRRVATIVIPAIELYRLEWKMGEVQRNLITWPQVHKQRSAHTMAYLDQVKEPAKFYVPQESLDRINDRFKGRRPVVVVLRDAGNKKERNSGPAWRKWARDHEAEVIEDFSEEQMSLADRAAAYELASMTIGVASGNMAPVFYSHRPFISFKWGVDGKLKRHNVTAGWRGAWMNERQKLVWGDSDTYLEIDNEVQLMQKTLIQESDIA